MSQFCYVQYNESHWPMYEHQCDSTGIAQLVVMLLASLEKKHAQIHLKKTKNISESGSKKRLNEKKFN